MTSKTANHSNQSRRIRQVIPAIDTADGDGVKLRRSIGAMPGLRHDPFLMLDEIMSDDAADYIGGFPPHPHRGFETVTYMLEGRMQHKDHMGNVGLLKPGGAQWMTAGRGVIHEEMPQQDSGRLHGFQLWLNLPAAEKMQPADYRDIEPEQIAEATGNGATVRVIAGVVEFAGKALSGPINGTAYPVSTDPLMVDVKLAANSEINVPIKTGHNAFVYLFEGDLEIAGQAATAPAAITLTDGATVNIKSASGAQLLLLAGKPINEPVAQRGPFVMNTQEELYQAMKDYGNGSLTSGGVAPQ